MTIMDVTIVNVALPTIGRTFRVPSTSVASVSIYFSVSLAVFISASGWLGDRFGGKRVLLAAIAVFTAASAAGVAIVGAAVALTIHDADAASTMVRRGRRGARPADRAAPAGLTPGQGSAQA